MPGSLHNYLIMDLKCNYFNQRFLHYTNSLALNTRSFALAEMGFAPTRHSCPWILSPMRILVSPFRQKWWVLVSSLYYEINRIKTLDSSHLFNIRELICHMSNECFLLFKLNLSIECYQLYLHSRTVIFSQLISIQRPI